MKYGVSTLSGNAPTERSENGQREGGREGEREGGREGGREGEREGEREGLTLCPH